MSESIHQIQVELDDIEKILVRRPRARCTVRLANTLRRIRSVASTDTFDFASKMVCLQYIRLRKISLHRSDPALSSAAVENLIRADLNCLSAGAIAGLLSRASTQENTMPQSKSEVATNYMISANVPAPNRPTALSADVVASGFVADDVAAAHVRVRNNVTGRTVEGQGSAKRQDPDTPSEKIGAGLALGRALVNAGEQLIAEARQASYANCPNRATNAKAPVNLCSEADIFGPMPPLVSEEQRVIDELRAQNRKLSHDLRTVRRALSEKAPVTNMTTVINQLPDPTPAKTAKKAPAQKPVARKAPAKKPAARKPTKKVSF